ncbi:MAG TPA: hypothetical protein V6C81_23395 [Planktothrix sp.]|jgi:DNA uptake protein ComE-like DNA-binding protein
MPAKVAELQEILDIIPEWSPVYDSLLSQRAGDGGAKLGSFELLERLGAKAMYAKLLNHPQNKRLGCIVRDWYLQPLLTKMMTSNQNLRRFWSQRRVAPDTQGAQARSFAVELAQKLDGVLAKHLTQSNEDGFKVLLPAYIQRSVHNFVIDHIRDEWEWEKATLQDLNLDPEQEDPRQRTADDPVYSPENRAISAEEVRYSNELRQKMTALLQDAKVQRQPLVVVDCMFGMGLTEHSQAGVEMTMRECCDKLNLPGDTQARKIARCQVLLDKGLDMVRQMVREKMPAVADFWQCDTNINTASRRELGYYLGLTEGEVERLIAWRQYYSLDELVERSVIKPGRLSELRSKGAVAAFVPLDLNSATVRDIIDILGVPKEAAQKIGAQRPFSQMKQLVEQKILDNKAVETIINRGAVLKIKAQTGQRPDLNRIKEDEVAALGVPPEIAERLVRGRPFATWAELEEFVSCDATAWSVLRQNFCLGLAPG